MSTKKELKPQVPGEKPDLSQMPPQEGAPKEGADLQAGNDSDEGGSGQDDDSTIEISRSELKLLIDDAVEANKAEMDQLIDDAVEKRVVSEVKAARRRAELAKHPKQENLPDQKEIDISKIDRAVLTKDGWVCPVVHPSDKRAIQMRGNELI